MKKKIILLMAIAMSIFILVGCTDKEDKYSNSTAGCIRYSGRQWKRG